MDKTALFALASDTRLEMLKALQGERRTLSQLAEHLDVDKAAVHRHLRKLEDGGLVKRAEDHGFVYYSLSWKARDLISPGENTRIVVMLSTSMILLVICSVLLMVASSGVPGVGEASDNYDPASSPLVSEKVQEVQYALYSVVAIIALMAAVAFYLGYGMLNRPRQSKAEEAEDRERSNDLEEPPLEDHS